MSALIQMRNSAGHFIQTRALLDTCATANFITDELANKLKLPMQTCSIPIGAVNDLSPNEVFPRESIQIPKTLKLADPQFHLPKPVDVLIGSGTTLSLLSIGQINLSRNDCDLILQKIQLGWVVAGGVNDENHNQSVACQLTDLSNQLTRFWIIEDAGSQNSKSFEESSCEAHYQLHTTRETSGRYVVRLPFRVDKVDFGDSKTQAYRRFLSLQKRLNADPHLKTEYFKVMQEYINLGHMVPVSDEQISGYYMPHHPVIKASSNTTKVRVVFDASAKSDKGISLNGALLTGPTIQDKLFTHLLRFRTHTYVMTADIAQMYRQILIHPDDRRYQRILWYADDKIATFEINRVTFGVSSAPYLAIRTLKQLADDERSNFPNAAKILTRDLYVDDLLSGANTLSEVLQLRDEIILLLRRGGFDIRQWASNHRHALDNFDERTLDLDCAIEDNPISKTLGIVWNSDFSIERHISVPDAANIQLHGFCDASKVGYGACLYIRSTDQQGRVLIRLACAKSRVSPLKEVTIPRLELCAAQLLSRLYNESVSAFDFPISQIIFWTDSTIVLQWLKRSPQSLKVFEANRVMEIQSLGDKVEWRHVRTKDNPADALSRGQLPAEFLTNKLWFKGPHWLKLDHKEWPISISTIPSELPGLRKNTCLFATCTDMFQRFSSYTTLIHSIAYCLRMRKSNKFKGKGLEVTEKLQAETKILLLIQNEQYSYEIEQIRETGETKNLRLRGLNPFIDQHGLLRGLVDV
ncbi:uncharacterized protein LOC123259004 [Cotesia glomerata]|uniref:uncharacterized protein LOC123259004 n=1 Tax=Cotesia glomerata TaxID=32391 RepID=UPI001D013D9C|nr:uncharacterized protein LOC123259004 [Cotesia glomerata]